MTIKQKQLLLCCFDLLTVNDVDGIWGPQSMEATKELQRRLGLTEDGIFGINTAAEVGELIADGKNLPEEPKQETAGLFWDHIRHWTREEFRCRCREYYATPYCDGFPVEPDQTLVELVDDIREKAGAPGIRSSGIRCPWHNKNSGGVANSKHLSGKALDFCIQGMPGARLLALAKGDPRTSYAYQITDENGNLTDYVHVDVK